MLLLSYTTKVTALDEYNTLVLHFDLTKNTRFAIIYK